MNAEQLEKWVKENADFAGDNIPMAPVVLASDLRALFDGNVLVPIKPSHAMLMAGAAEVERDDDEDSYRAIGQAICVWDAMLAASQEQGQ